MIYTFHHADKTSLYMKIQDLINSNSNFNVRCYMNADGTVHHWELKEYVN